jgi:hypothetical protein
VAGAVDDQDSLIGRIHKPDDIGVDPQIAPEPVGEQVGARPIADLPEVRQALVEGDVLRGLFVAVHIKEGLENRVRPQVLALCLHLRVEAAHNLVQLF